MDLYVFYGVWIVILACTVGLAWFAAKRRWRAFGGIAIVLGSLFAVILISAAANDQLG